MLDAYPGTESPSRMIVESAMCLVEDADKVEVGGGSWTPCSAMGELLFDCLVAHAGLSFEVEWGTEVGDATSDSGAAR